MKRDMTQKKMDIPYYDAKDQSARKVFSKRKIDSKPV
jgi:hypothetical protein